MVSHINEDARNESNKSFVNNLLGNLQSCDDGSINKTFDLLEGQCITQTETCPILRDVISNNEECHTASFFLSQQNCSLLLVKVNSFFTNAARLIDQKKSCFPTNEIFMNEMREVVLHLVHSRENYEKFNFQLFDKLGNQTNIVLHSFSLSIVNYFRR